MAAGTRRCVCGYTEFSERKSAVERTVRRWILRGTVGARKGDTGVGTFYGQAEAGATDYGAYDASYKAIETSVMCRSCGRSRHRVERGGGAFLASYIDGSVLYIIASDIGPVADYRVRITGPVGGEDTFVLIIPTLVDAEPVAVSADNAIVNAGSPGAVQARTLLSVPWPYTVEGPFVVTVEHGDLEWEIVTVVGVDGAGGGGGGGVTVEAGVPALMELYSVDQIRTAGATALPDHSQWATNIINEPAGDVFWVVSRFDVANTYRRSYADGSEVTTDLDACRDIAFGAGGVVVAIRSDSSLYRSVDGGDTFVEVVVFPTISQNFTRVVYADGFFLLFTPDGFVAGKSATGAVGTWSEVTTSGLMEEKIMPDTLGVDPFLDVQVMGGVIYHSYHEGHSTTKLRVARSVDGESWDETALGVPSQGYEFDCFAYLGGDPVVFATRTIDGRSGYYRWNGTAWGSFTLLPATIEGAVWHPRRVVELLDGRILISNSNYEEITVSWVVANGGLTEFYVRRTVENLTGSSPQYLSVGDGDVVVFTNEQGVWLSAPGTWNDSAIETAAGIDGFTSMVVGPSAGAGRQGNYIARHMPDDRWLVRVLTDLIPYTSTIVGVGNVGASGSTVLVPLVGSLNDVSAVFVPRSTNGGDTFSSVVAVPLDETNAVYWGAGGSVVFGSGANLVLMAGTGYDCYRSTNGGASYTQATAPLDSGEFALVRFRYLNSAHYALFRNEAFEHRLFRSTDNGQTWTECTINIAGTTALITDVSFVNSTYVLTGAGVGVDEIPYHAMWTSSAGLIFDEEALTSLGVFESGVLDAALGHAGALFVGIVAAEPLLYTVGTADDFGPIEQNIGLESSGVTELVVSESVLYGCTANNAWSCSLAVTGGGTVYVLPEG